MSKRVCAVSDTHLFRQPLPDEVCEIIGEQNPDVILHAGDILEMSVIEQLREISEVIAVCGNMDYGEVKKCLPKREIVEIEGLRIGLIHGWGGGNPVARVAEAFCNVGLIVFGHTHEPFLGISEGIAFLNPGSPTDKMFVPLNEYGKPLNTIGVIDICNAEIRRCDVIDITGSKVLPS